MGDSSSHGKGNATWSASSKGLNSSGRSSLGGSSGKLSLGGSSGRPKASSSALFGNLMVGVGPSSSPSPAASRELSAPGMPALFPVNNSSLSSSIPASGMKRSSMKRGSNTAPGRSSVSLLPNLTESPESPGTPSVLSPANRSALRGTRNSKTGAAPLGTLTSSQDSQSLGSVLGRKSKTILIDSDDEDSESNSDSDDSESNNNNGSMTLEEVNNLEAEIQDISTRLSPPPPRTRSAGRQSILGRTAHSAMGFMQLHGSHNQSFQASIRVATSSDDGSRSPPRRTQSGRESLLGRRRDRNREPPSLTKALASTGTAAGLSLKRTVSNTGALVSRTGAVMGKTLRTKSGSFDLRDMQKGLTGSVGRSTPGRAQSSILLGGRTSGRDPEPDVLISEIVKWSPLDAEDRAKYEEADVTVKRLLRRKPDAVRAMYEFKLGGRGNPTVKRYPLSHLVAMGASEQVVRLAMKACPEALQPSRDFRSTALHTACSFNTDIEVVKCIYQKHPDAIKETTNYVYLPLHNACQTSAPEPCSLELVQFLVEAYPTGLMTMNKLGDTPLRTAQRNENISKDVLEYLEQETERVLNLAENASRKKSIVERQSWGSKEMRKSSDRSLLDDTDHSTVSLGFSSGLPAPNSEELKAPAEESVCAESEAEAITEHTIEAETNFRTLT